MNGSSWLLGGGYPWDPGTTPDRPKAASKQVVANAQRGLSLATKPDGPLGLVSADGSLGRLTLPTGVAVDGTDVLILSEDGSLVYRYDAVRATLTPLPEVGAAGLSAHAPDDAFLEPRRFRQAANIAATGGLLYVADPAAHRVHVIDLDTLVVVRMHVGLRDPIDVGAGGGGVYVLDRAAGRVYRGDAVSDELTLVVDAPTYQGKWTRIAVDRHERVYVYDSTATALDVFETTGPAPANAPVARVTDPFAVRDRFNPPRVVSDGRGGFSLPDDLADPCGLRKPLSPHVRVWRAADAIYRIDGETRILTVHLPDGRVRHRFGPYDREGRDVALDTDGSWSPADIAGLDGCVLVLDERHQTVYAHRPGSELLQRWFTAPADANTQWRRIAEDGNGCLLLWDGVSATVDRVDPHGKRLGTVPVRDVGGRFDRHVVPPADLAPRATVRLTRRGAIPGRAGEAPVLPVPTWVTAGAWISQWLDSDIYNCQWHVLELWVQHLPPGSRLTIRTRTTNEPGDDRDNLAALTAAASVGSWQSAPALEGIPQPDENERKPRKVDVLVPSGPGQFLQVLIEFAGTGLDTPIVGSVRLRFPRESLLQYLPAIFSSPEEQRDFLDRFLSIVQTTWGGIEREIDTFGRFLDPDSVPAESMDYLAGWFDLRLEGTWEPEERRRLLQAMPGLRTTWGTTDGMRRWLRVYLAHLGHVSETDLEHAGIPGIVESFVDRRRLMLGRDDTGTLGAAGALWSPSVERRFQVGVFDQEGEVALVSTPEPDLDFVRRFAHAFRVFVPAAWVRTPDDEAMLRRAIELQKPAHTTYELVLVEPRFRIGDQSTIDLDTVIGAPLGSQLVSATTDDAPSRPPYQRLGFDVMLGCAEDRERHARLERRLD